MSRLEEDEKLVLTPFEKNIEVWRQLWRVLERSDIVVQVQLFNFMSSNNTSCIAADMLGAAAVLLVEVLP